MSLARALRLTSAEIDELLLAADHLPLAQLEPSIVRLPADITPFIGRKRPLTQLRTLLQKPRTRLVTIAGLGGTGKTRLAIEAARQLSDRFPDGVYFVSLTGIDPTADNLHDQFWTHIVRELHIPRDANTAAQLLAQTFLRGKNALIILDNFEELLPCRTEVLQLLRQCHALTLLVTSRVRLDVQAEQLLPLNGFDDVDAAFTLFMETARRRQPNYEPSEAEVVDIHTLCDGVEGMPLAIELAAIWVDTLPPADLLMQLQTSPDQLAHPAIDRPQRQHSMDVVWDATWGMLSADLQASILQLAPLQGTFTPAAALVIGSLTLAQLHQLVQYAIVQQRENKRLAIHELIRQFLVHKANAEVERGYIHYYLKLLAKLTRELRQTMRASLVTEISADWHHFDRAWWIAVKAGRCDLLSPCIDIVMYFEAPAIWGVGRTFLERTRDNAPPACRRLRAQCDEGIAILSVQLYDAISAEKLANRALTTFAEVGQIGDGIYARIALCWVDYALRRYDEKDTFVQSVLAACENHLTMFGRMLPHLFAGSQSCKRGDFASALATHQTLYAISNVDSYHLPAIDCMIGLSYRGLGDDTNARLHFQAALRRANQIDGYAAIVIATYELCRLDAPHAPYETRLNALQSLIGRLGTTQVVGNIAVHLGMYYLAYGFNAQGYELSRIGVKLLRGVTGRAEWTATAVRIGRFFFIYGVVQTLPSWLLPARRVRKSVSWTFDKI